MAERPFPRRRAEPVSRAPERGEVAPETTDTPDGPPAHLASLRSAVAAALAVTAADEANTPEPEASAAPEPTAASPEPTVAPRTSIAPAVRVAEGPPMAAELPKPDVPVPSVVPREPAPTPADRPVAEFTDEAPPVPVAAEAAPPVTVIPEVAAPRAALGADAGPRAGPRGRDEDDESQSRRRPSVTLRVALRVVIAAWVGLAGLLAVAYVQTRNRAAPVRAAPVRAAPVGAQKSGPANGLSIPSPLIPEN